MRTSLRIFALVLLVLNFHTLNSQNTYAQGKKTVECGDTVYDAEFKNQGDQHEYFIEQKARGSFEASALAAGQQLQLVVRIFSPAGGQVDSTWSLKNPIAKSGELSQSGKYRVLVIAYQNAGVYSISFACGGITPDTKPTAQPNKPGNQSTEPTTKSQEAFSGIGVPAQQGIDFTNIESTIVKSGEIITDSIDSTAITPKLFTVEAKSKQTLTLSYKRLAGNANDVNLGIAILGPNNSLLFNANLISTDEFNTKIILPADGKYTIGVYRVELNPPEKPKATSFELTATVN